MRNKCFINNILLKIATYAVLLLSRLISWKKKERIWLIACDSKRWGDNADVFWRYMNYNHPEIKAIAVVTNRDMLDKNEKNWLARKRLYTFILILLAEVIATTHSLSDVGPDSLTSISKAKKIWLQHGVTGIGKINATHAKSGKYDMICVNSAREKEIMKQDLGIDPNLISVTGFARHDRLKEIMSQKGDRDGILFVPTSRAWLDKTEKKEYEKILFSWVKVLSERDRKTVVRAWLHPGWQKIGLENLGLVYTGIYHYDFKNDPQKLILESKLLITDYSSICFDAVLTGIPVIFYQPDKASYIEKKGLFKDFLEQEHLLITENQSDLILHLEALLNDDDYYNQRLEKDREWVFKFVETFDGKSCQRIFNQAEQLLQVKIGE